MSDRISRDDHPEPAHAPKVQTTEVPSPAAAKPIKVPGPDHPISIERNSGRVVVSVSGRVIADTREALDDWTGAERPFPVYTLRVEPPGGWQQEPDLRIDAVTTSRRVTIGWESEFKVKVSGQGTRADGVEKVGATDA